MIRIDHSYYLELLAAIPLMVAVYFIYKWWSRKAMNRFGEWQIVKQIIPGFSKSKPLTKFIIVIIAFAFAVIGLANPQWGKVNRSIQHQGIDLAIVLDVSNSMLAQDVTPDRLTVAKELASQFINRFPDDRITLITFAGESFLQLPLTPDHAAVQMLVTSASIKNAPPQGSDIGAAITEAINALPDNVHHYKAMVLISDGEDQENNIGDALREAVDNHIMICAVGIGTTKGSFVPDGNTTQTSFRKDANGESILSKLNPETLQAIASETNGMYIHAPSSDDKSLEKIAARLDGVKKNVYDEKLFVDYESRFQYFLFAALFFLILDLFISNKRQKWFRKKILLPFIFFFLNISLLSAQTPEEYIAGGNKAYTQKNYSDALKYYQLAIDNDASHKYPQAIFNLGNVFYQQHKYKEAADEFNSVILYASTPDLKAQAYYNLGNCLLAQNEFKESISVFEKTLMLNPDDKDAQYNLAYAKAMMAKLQQKNQSKTVEKKNPKQKENDLTKEELEKLQNELNQSELLTIEKIKHPLNRGNKKLKDW